MNYFTYLSRHNEPKNALQRSAIALLKDESNLLINDWVRYVEQLRESISKLNIEHPRCQPLRFATYGSGGINDQIGITLGAHCTVGFYLYPIKNY